MKTTGQAVDPFMGEEIEWSIIIKDISGSYRLPFPNEFRTMINIFRAFIKYPKIDARNWQGSFEDTGGLTTEEDWKKFLDSLSKEKDPFLDKGDFGILPSGCRFYIDGAHLESSSSGCRSVRDLIISGRAMEMMLNICARVMEKKFLPAGCEMRVHKDTSNRKESTFAGHENYLINMETFRELTLNITEKTMLLASFLALRIPLIGAGKTGADNGTPFAHFQISQRADWIETILNLSTTAFRPLVNRRDEPHARFTEIGGKKIPLSRLHIICGDPNMSPWAMKMRFGLTSLFLLGLQDGIFDDIKDEIILAKPVQTIKFISRDLLTKHVLELASGKKAKFYEILRVINDRLRKYFSEAREATGEQLSVLKEVEHYCDSFAKGPKYYLNMLMPYLDWINRFDVCNVAFRAGEKWSNAGRGTRELIYGYDQLYSLIKQEESLYYGRERDYTQAGVADFGINQEEIKNRLFNAPIDSREYLRGEILKRFPGILADWGAVFLPERRVLYLGDPFRGSKEEIGSLVEECVNEQDLVNKLKRMGFEIFRK